MARNQNNKQQNQDRPNPKSNDNNKGHGNQKGNNKGNNKPNVKEQTSDRGSTKNLMLTGADKQSPTNNPAWYFLDQEQATQVTNYSFQTLMGAGDVFENVTVPTVMGIYCNPSPGVTYDTSNQGEYTSAANSHPGAVLGGNDGANYMASRMYTMLSAYSGRNVNYQPNDVLVDILSVTSIAEAIESMRRAFGISFLYSVYNRAVPQRMFELMGIDWYDFIENRSQYRDRLNYQISRINQIPILGNIAYITKSMEFYQQVYADSESEYAQYFMYIPATLWKLGESSFDSGSYLHTVAWMAENVDQDENHLYVERPNFDFDTTFDTLLYKLTDMIDRVLNSTTLNLVHMDLLNLASKTSGITFLSFDYISDAYVVKPVYDPIMNLQVHNMHLPGSNCLFHDPSATSAWKNITDSSGNVIKVTYRNDVATDANTGTIVYNPALWEWTSTDSAMIPQLMESFIVDFPSTPDLTQKIEAQRLVSGMAYWKWKDTDSNNTFHYMNTFSDHYPVFIHVLSIRSRKASQATPSDSQLFQGSLDISVYPWASTTLEHERDTANTLINVAGALSKFSCAPFIYLIYKDYGIYQMVGDLTTFTTIPWDKVARMQTIMYTGLFGFRVK